MLGGGEWLWGGGGMVCEDSAIPEDFDLLTFLKGVHTGDQRNNSWSKFGVTCI